MSRSERLFQYQEIAQVLKEQILRGDFKADGRLPSERVLGIRFNVQRNTVRQALATLETEGQISTQGKRGSFVRMPSAKVGHKAFHINIHSDSSPHLRYLVDGFMQVADHAGYTTRRINTDPPKGAMLDPVPQLERLAEDTAGVVLWPQNPTDSDALTRLNKAVPLVLVDRRVLGLSADCVRFDDLEGGRLITEHLVAQGHRRIGFLTDDVFAETVQRRWHGYVLALETAGIPIDASLSLFFHGLDAQIMALTIRHILGRGKTAPTAIVCSNDLVAFTLLRFLHDEGVRVPDDLAVTGYGNSIPDYTEAMSLTSVDQPFFELGQAAANILIDRVGQTASERLRSPHDIRIPVELVVRGSSVRA